MTDLDTTGTTPTTGTTRTPSPHARTLPGRRMVGVALAAIIALGACTSDPGPRRVAQDIINAEAENNPDLDRECMLDALGEFSDDDLESISQQLDSANTETQAEGEAAFAEFRRSLSACN